MAINRQTNGILWATFFLMVLIVGGLGFYMYGKPATQTIVSTSTTPGSAPATSVGTAATLKVLAQDMAPLTSTKNQIASPLYAWKKNTPGSLLANALSLSATDRTNVAGVNVGDEVSMISFNGTYYGDSVSKVVSQENDVADVPIYFIARYLDVNLLKGATQFTGKDGKGAWALYGNISVQANGVEDFKLIIKNNYTSSEYRLYGIGFDTVVGSNVSTITNEGLSAVNSMPIRLKDSLNILLTYDAPVKLKEFDSVTTPSFKLTADGDGCTKASEVVTTYVMDKAYFKSVAGPTVNQILEGMEDDASSPSDVGGPDVTVDLRCNSGQ